MVVLGTHENNGVGGKENDNSLVVGARYMLLSMVSTPSICGTGEDVAWLAAPVLERSGRGQPSERRVESTAVPL